MHESDYRREFSKSIRLFVSGRISPPFNLNSAVKEDENGADAQKHEGF
jgi:hypothetical protein